MLVIFANDLPMELTRRRNIHHTITLDRGMAGETLMGSQLSPLRIPSFGFGDRAQMVRRRANSFCGKFTFMQKRLATTTDASSTTNGIEIYAKLSSRRQEVRSHWELPALARRREDHPSLFVLCAHRYTLPIFRREHTTRPNHPFKMFRRVHRFQSISLGRSGLLEIPFNIPTDSTPILEILLA